MRFSMKYSSTSSLALSGTSGTIVAFMALLALSDRARVLEIPQHADAPDHNVPADVVHVERRADRSQHQDRQRAAEMLPELVEPAQHAVRVRRTVRQGVEMLAELRACRPSSPSAGSSEMMRRQSSSGRNPARYE